MLDSGYLGQLITGIFYLIVGTALLRLSRRTGEKPERHLGFYFLLTGVDYFSYSITYVFQLESLYVQAGFLARVAYAIAVVHLVIFIRDVFRRGEIWATWLAALCSLSVFAGIVGACALGDWEGVEINSPWYWSNFLGYTVALIWLTYEAFHAHSGASKCQRIGLCDRTVVNRYLLWGGFGAFQVVACAVILVMGMDFGAGATVSSTTDLMLSASEIASIAMLWLVFFPPAAYLSWIAGSLTDADSPAEG